jgi:hypothetical protein
MLGGWGREWIRRKYRPGICCIVKFVLVTAIASSSERRQGIAKNRNTAI